MKISGLILTLILISTATLVNDHIILQAAGEPNTAVNPRFVGKFGTHGFGNGQFHYPYGTAANNAYIFVANTNSHNVQIFDSAGNFVKKFGGSGSGDGQFDQAMGIAINDTHIFVVDVNNNRVQIFDLAGTFVTKFGSFGTGDRQFNYPYGIAVNDRHIFVLDSYNARIQIFDSAGNFVTKFGSLGTGNGQFNYPYGIGVNDTHIFVTDYQLHRVQIFDLAGNFAAKFGSRGSGDGQFNHPWGIAINEANIFIADSWNNRIQVFDLTGRFIKKFGSSGSGDGQFNIPNGIGVNDTHIFVADTSNHRIQIFSINSPPQQLTAHPSLTSIGLTWSPPVDILNNPEILYRIYKGTQSRDYILLHETSLLYHNDLNVIVDKTFYYSVTAVTASGETMYSNEISAKVGSQVAPTETVTQTQTETTTETITISDTITSTDTVTTTETSTETQSETTTETTTDTVTTTDIVTTTYTQPAEKVSHPYSLSASATDFSVTLSWNPPTTTQSPITGYNIYRGNTSDGNYSLVGTASSTTFTDTAVMKGSTHFYMVTAATDLGESLPSNIILITVLEGETNITPNNTLFMYLGILVLVATYTRFRYLRRKPKKI
jgi:fibronectin type 3 domain-containing protein